MTLSKNQKFVAVLSKFGGDCYYCVEVEHRKPYSAFSVVHYERNEFLCCRSCMYGSWDKTCEFELLETGEKMSYAEFHRRYKRA